MARGPYYPRPYYTCRPSPAYLLINTLMVLTKQPLYLLPHPQTPQKYSFLKHILLFGKAE